MAPRTRTVNLPTRNEFDGSYDLESSPDPLATSITEYTAPTRRMSARPSRPLTSASPSKQNKVSHYAEIEPVSPSKSMVLNTPRAAGASPWRIKVTVQAEPGSDAENMDSPTVKRVTRTKTTTVPLKDPDASSPVKRRGRPRKSDATSAKAKRSGTPVRRATKSKTRASSVGAEGSTADVDTDAPVKKRRGRPRKSIQPPAEDNDTLVAGEPVVQRVPVLDDAPAENPQREVGAITRSTSSPAIGTETTRVSPREQQQTEPSRKIRARKGTPARKSRILLELSSDEDSDENDGADTPEDTDGGSQGAQEIRNTESKEETTFSAPEGDYSDVDDGIQDITGFAFEEGATRMPDDTTILESESFSMVSVDSLPSSGGLTSPVNPPAERTTPVATMETIRESKDLQNLSVDALQPDSRISSASGSAQVPPMDILSNASLEPSSLAPPRHKTPSIETRSPSQPPPLEPGRYSPTEAKTPKIGRVMKAGVALQGVLDPNRVTPEASHIKIVEEDIFRGFSERTRRELQAGLRLGEQLAQQPPSVRHSPALSSPIKAKAADTVSDACGHVRQRRIPRLPTPEDQGDCELPSPPPIHTTDVQYPTLNVDDSGSQLLSPARSDDEMSWRVDTPPVRFNSAQSHEIAAVSTGAGRLVRSQEKLALLAENESDKNDKHADIWEEEASRSSNPPIGNDELEEISPQLEDLFMQEGALKPARSKLPRTWRRKSSGDFQYSDEAEEVPATTPSSTESDEANDERVDKGKQKIVEQVTGAQDFGDDEDEMSEASDDTGMFFANNLPNVFNKRRSTESRKKKAEKLDLSLLMHESESMVPESSPPVVKARTPGINKLNPFLDTPPRFAAFQSSPIKGSPLRQELRASDTSSDSVRQEFEESTLPLPPSSPFHTQVDGESAVAAASDQRQLQEEMAGATDSSLRIIRNEADGYLDAYEPQERTLGEIEEVTEPSRTWSKETSEVFSASPVKKAFEASMVRPARTYAPLFTTGTERNEPEPAAATSSTAAMKMKAPSKTPQSALPEEKPSQPAQPSSGVFGRLTSTLWGALGSAPPPPNHPILSRFDRLPKVEPWTKTHYKTLDALYQRHKKQPALFLPSISAQTTNTNNAIMEDFLRKHKRSFVGARYAVWGYSVTLDESLVVLCAAFMQLLVLKDAREYEEVTQKRIQMGDCGPGVSGEEILAEEVMKRLATVIMGEKLRRDEKKGIEVDRTGTLTITWPA